MAGARAAGPGGTWWPGGRGLSRGRYRCLAFNHQDASKAQVREPPVRGHALAIRHGPILGGPANDVLGIAAA